MKTLRLMQCLLVTHYVVPLGQGGRASSTRSSAPEIGRSYPSISALDKNLMLLPGLYTLFSKMRRGES